MRQRIVFAAAFGVAMGIGIATALAGTPGYYVSGEGGVSLPPDLHLNDVALGTQHESFGTGFAAGGALGYDYGDGWRLELNSLYQHTDLSRLDGAAATGHLSSTTVMANATYDLLSNQQFTPYVGAGLGMANVGGQVGGLSGRDWKPAYQAEAGLRTDVNDNTSLFGEYRFSQSESVLMADAGDSAHQHFTDHALLAGLSFKLN
ncbi:MAG TPA: outer membrane beta-barrel protein [Rhizomicrobium sp.]|jgi:OOP family OmpA-OmpF porin|nr:outer membrane beta-barrel protein [Rhizomicrobium sp.]